MPMGVATVMASDATDALRVTLLITNHDTKSTALTSGKSTNSAPPPDATPLPPLNLRNTGATCPTIAPHIAA